MNATVKQVLAALIAMTMAAGAPAAEYTFDAAQFERKAFELGGYAEYRHDRFDLNRDGTFYKLGYYGRERDAVDRNTALLKLEGRYTRGSASLRARTHLEYTDDQLDSERTGRFDELALAWKPYPSVALETGKIALKWGKGYAWNPVGFVERMKDPNDPELAREGYWMAAVDWVKTFDGPLKTVAFTPVVLPVRGDVNSNYGKRGHTNVAAKLYLLWHDTDIDIVYLAAGSRSTRFGFDFSRNVTSNLEVHGEWARMKDVEHRVVTASGATRVTQRDADSYLIGLRYLTASDATLILEYYRNGAGYTQSEMRDFSTLVDTGYTRYRATGDDALLQLANRSAVAGYGRPQPMRHYAYLRASQKDPFDILYFTPALTSIVNLTDGSFSVTPELLYTGFTNVELRLRLFFLSGGERTDFGEKQNSRRVELRARLYF